MNNHCSTEIAQHNSLQASGTLCFSSYSFASSPQLFSSFLLFFIRWRSSYYRPRTTQGPAKRQLPGIHSFPGRAAVFRVIAIRLESEAGYQSGKRFSIRDKIGLRDYCASQFLGFNTRYVCLRAGRVAYKNNRCHCT